MNIIVEHINFEEALRYLGAGGKEISPEMDALLKAAEKDLLEVASPKVTYKIEENEIVFAATLGALVDKLIAKKQISDMAAAVMIDGLASAMIEQVLDEFENKMRDVVAAGSSPVKILGPRFSPGYGDFPLEAQKNILQFLDAEKLIGLTLTSGGMLSPIKSVTGIIRIYSGDENSSINLSETGDKNFSVNLDACSGCENCKMKSECAFRKNKSSSECGNRQKGDNA